eukprot:7305032-Ditylum_brightwellii.AAC.1
MALINFTGDETSWVHQRQEEPRAVISREYSTRLGHKLWVIPAGFTEGTNKVRMIFDKLDVMIVGKNRENKKVKKIFTKRAVIVWDHYFSVDAIFYHTRKRGFGLLITAKCDMLPKGVPAQFLHKTRNFCRQ